jgi:hypothetical protein
MAEPQDALAGTFVEPRGMIRSVVANVAGRQALGAVGAAVATEAAQAGAAESSPIGKGQIAYLAVFGTEIVLFKAKRGAFKPKPTTEAIAAAPRSDLRAASVEKGRIAGVLAIAFAEDVTWEFDVPKVHLKGAQQIAAALS